MSILAKYHEKIMEGGFVWESADFDYLYRLAEADISFNRVSLPSDAVNDAKTFDRDMNRRITVEQYENDLRILQNALQGCERITAEILQRVSEVLTKQPFSSQLNEELSTDVRENVYYNFINRIAWKYGQRAWRVLHEREQEKLTRESMRAFGGDSTIKETDCIIQYIEHHITTVLDLPMKHLFVLEPGDEPQGLLRRYLSNLMEWLRRR